MNFESEIERQKKETQEGRDTQLLRFMKNLFCFSNIRKNKINSEALKERSKYYQGGNFFNQIKNMPLLAYYIMCLYEYYSYKVTKKVSNSEEYLRKLIFDARDMADGLLQLMENAMNHSENMNGYLCFRVYSTEKVDTIKKLEDRFVNYLHDRKGKHNFYLEAHIIDYSHESLPQKFISKIAERQQASTDDSKEIYDSVLEGFANPQIRTFFDPNEDEKKSWVLYNSIATNVVHHYGLQLFDSLITNSDGCFIARSSKDCMIEPSGYYSNTERYSNVKKIPGTQYTILIPFKEVDAAVHNYTALSGSVNFNDNLTYPYTTEKGFPFDEKTCKSYYSEINTEDIHSLQERKEKLIDNMSKGFAEHIVKNRSDESNTIFYYDANDLPSRRIEFLAKAIISFLVKYANKKLDVAIFNCDDNFILEIVRIFAVFYNKEGKNEFMHNVQIYLYGRDFEEEFIITGNSLAAFLSYSEKIAFSRGTNPRCVKTIIQMLDKRITHSRQNGEKTEEKIKPLELTPFSLQRYQKIEQGVVPFERNVKNVLEADLQKTPFGCKLSPTHMRIGSKIHIDSFYEAELLFHNSYYVSHFSYILAKEIYDIISTKKIATGKDIVLIGYETYSDMLLYEIVVKLKKFIESDGFDSLPDGQLVMTEKADKPHIRYIIYSDNKKSANDQNLTDKFNFKHITDISITENPLYVVVIPINSTLTTHNKVISALAKYLKNAKSVKNAEPKIIANYAVVLGRDSKGGLILSEDEKRFWTKIKIKPYKKEVETDLIEYGKKTVRFFIDVNTTWYNPLICEKCFPPNPNMEYYKEEPLIETDKTSVVPMQKIGLKPDKENANENPNIAKLMSIDNIGRIRMLENYLIYRHIERKGNHFSFYFQTEELMLEKKDEVTNWLKGLSGKINTTSDDRLTYDIIVAPRHFSNSAFVKEFERQVFSNVSLILFIDAEKEFRENIKTKYSNLCALYENLESAERKSNIRFHFVDDTIVSGSSFMRVKSILASIFPDKAFTSEFVSIEIFKSITLLINRCSLATKENYIKDLNMFNAFVELNISSMRNHEDACVLCKFVSNFTVLSEYSSTNVLYDYCIKKIDKHGVLEINESTSIKKNDKEKKARAFRRMICSHIANCELQSKERAANEKETAFNMMIGLLEGSPSAMCVDAHTKLHDGYHNAEYLISYIKVLSRPFFSYSKSYKEAIFEIMIRILDYLIAEEDDKKNKATESDSEYKEIYKIIDGLNGYEIKYCLLITLIKRLADLGSSFIIRKENIRRIHAYHESALKSIDANIDEAICKTTGKSIDEGIDKNLDEPEKEKLRQLKREKFAKEYLSAIKRITCLSSDESKCVFLEYLLLFGEEYSNDIEKNLQSGKFNEKVADLVFGSFKENAYFENNRLLIDSIKDLNNDLGDEVEEIVNELGTNTKRDSTWFKDKVCKKDDEKVCTINDKFVTTLNKYYYENLVKTLVFTDAIDVKKDSVANRINVNNFKEGYELKLIAVIAIFHLLTGKSSISNGDIDKFYNVLTTLVRFATNSKTVCVILSDLPDNKNSFIPLACSKQDNEVMSAYNIDEKMKEMLEREMVLETYCINERTAMLKYDIALSEKENRKIYLLIEDSKLEGIQFKYAIKNIMIFRKLIVSKLLSDFTNNLISGKIAEKRRADALSHLKNASHSDSKYRREFVTAYLRQKLPSSIDTNLERCIGAAIRFMSDSFISEKYHSALVKRMSGDIERESIRLTSTKLHSNWVMLNIEILNKTAHFAHPDRVEMQKIDVYGNLDVLYVLPEKEVGESDALCILLSLVQNAIKYRKERSPVKVSFEIMKIGDKEVSFTVNHYHASNRTNKKRKGVLYYLTIENEVNYDFKNDAVKKQIEADIKKYLLENINERELKRQNDGITLYASNWYCEEILSGIESYKINSAEPVIAFDLYEEDNKNKIKFKLPILVDWK